MFSQEISKSFREKLLILYMLEELGLALSMGEIEEILLGHEILELFIINKNLTELSESGLVEEIADGEVALYRISEVGKDSLEAFRDKINEYHRARLELAVNLFKRKRSRERFIKASYRKVESRETLVECQINEMERPLFRLELRVPSNEEAEKICKAWNDRGVELFQEILQVLEK